MWKSRPEERGARTAFPHWSYGRCRSPGAVGASWRWCAALHLLLDCCAHVDVGLGGLRFGLVIEDCVCTPWFSSLCFGASLSIVQHLLEHCALGPDYISLSTAVSLFRSLLTVALSSSGSPSSPHCEQLYIALWPRLSMFPNRFLLHR